MNDTPQTESHILNRWFSHSCETVSADFARELERGNAHLRELLREALPTIDGDMADAWRTGIKQRIESALANTEVRHARADRGASPSVEASHE